MCMPETKQGYLLLKAFDTAQGKVGLNRDQLKEAMAKAAAKDPDRFGSALKSAVMESLLRQYWMSNGITYDKSTGYMRTELGKRQLKHLERFVHGRLIA